MDDIVKIDKVILQVIPWFWKVGKCLDNIVIFPLHYNPGSKFGEYDNKAKV